MDAAIKQLAEPLVGGDQGDFLLVVGQFVIEGGHQIVGFIAFGEQGVDAALPEAILQLFHAVCQLGGHGRAPCLVGRVELVPPTGAVTIKHGNHMAGIDLGKYGAHRLLQALATGLQ